MAEASLTFHRMALHTRYEWVQKSTEELALNEETYGKDVTFPVHTWTFGGAYNIVNSNTVRIALGEQLSVYRSAPALRSLYGSYPIAGEVYLRLYPKLIGAVNPRK